MLSRTPGEIQILDPVLRFFFDPAIDLAAGTFLIAKINRRDQHPVVLPGKRRFLLKNEAPG